MIFTQLETGQFQQFLTTSYIHFGHLKTPSFMIQIWRETQPTVLNLDLMTMPHGAHFLYHKMISPS
jgi:hypothetical protein